MIESMVYDLIVGDLKIQEKKARFRNPNFSIEICRGTKEAYLEEDFDILIIHLPEPHERAFYFIPTDKLIEHRFVKEKDQNEKITNTTLTLFPEEIGKRKDGNSCKNDWTIEFLCYYDDPNIDKRLLAIYNKQLLHESELIILKEPVFWDIKCISLNDLVVKWNLEVTYPSEKFDYTFILYEKRILLKTCTENSGNFRLSLRTGTRNKYSSHKEGGFDFIYSDLPERFKGFYLIPAKELTKRDFLANERTEGKKTMSIPFPETDVKSPHLTNVWANSYIFKYDDLNLKPKLLEFLDSQ